MYVQLHIDNAVLSETSCGEGQARRFVDEKLFDLLHAGNLDFVSWSIAFYPLPLRPDRLCAQRTPVISCYFPGDREIWVRR